jgi:hypothetical protein
MEGCMTNENDNPIILPDGSKIKQFSCSQDGQNPPLYNFLSEKGNLYVACNQGWPRIEKLNLLKLRKED